MSPTTESASSFESVVSDLKPLFDIQAPVCRLIEEMGFGPVSASAGRNGSTGTIDFSVVHFIILPHKSAWIDVLLETDRASSRALYEMFSGVREQSDADLEDVLRETMNMIHGVLKVAFRDRGADVIVPVVPQSVASDRLIYTPSGSCLHGSDSFHFAGVSLRLSMVARISPVTNKELRDVGLASVLAEALSPSGDETELVLLKKGTMINRHLLAKVRNLTSFADGSRVHPVIEPSPYAKLVNQA